MNGAQLLKVQSVSSELMNGPPACPCDEQRKRRMDWASGHSPWLLYLMVSLPPCIKSKQTIEVIGFLRFTG
jgi:hypothetical protein